MLTLTDEQIFGQGSDTEVVDVSVTSNFCPYLSVRCMCWDKGECQAEKAGGKCVLIDE